jgi:hypothetical protein
MVKPDSVAGLAGRTAMPGNGVIVALAEGKAAARSCWQPGVAQAAEADVCGTLVNYDARDLSGEVRVGECLEGEPVVRRIVVCGVVEECRRRGGRAGCGRGCGRWCG